MNRATFDDDDGGFAGNKSHGINSPGDEMLTLEQFLMEVDKSPGVSDRSLVLTEIHTHTHTH